jgi:hypothetical protein
MLLIMQSPPVQHLHPPEVQILPCAPILQLLNLCLDLGVTEHISLRRTQPVADFNFYVFRQDTETQKNLICLLVRITLKLILYFVSMDAINITFNVKYRFMNFAAFFKNFLVIIHNDIIL